MKSILYKLLWVLAWQYLNQYEIKSYNPHTREFPYSFPDSTSEKGRYRSALCQAVGTISERTGLTHSRLDTCANLVSLTLWPTTRGQNPATGRSYYSGSVPEQELSYTPTPTLTPTP
jgi:hypothetical protein